jgi:hypothetical protein
VVVILPTRLVTVMLPLQLPPAVVAVSDVPLAVMVDQVSHRHAAAAGGTAGGKAKARGMG